MARRYRAPKCFLILVEKSYEVKKIIVSLENNTKLKSNSKLIKPY